MIQVSSVTKSFPAPGGVVNAVVDVSFSVKSGEIVGFLGPNGAGKTTTMRLLTGIYRPTSGNITVSNLPPIEKRLEVLKEIGYLPENNPLYDDMRVSDYLGFVAEVKNARNLSEVVGTVALSDVVNKKIGQLSRGYRQRVGLAAALLGRPKILILDEPTSGLDPLEQDKIKTLIKKLAKDKIIVFSTHILSEVEAVATRLIIINHGKLVFDGKKPKGKGAVEKLFKKLVK